MALIVLLLERRWSSANDSNVDVCLMMYSVINSQLVSISCVWPGSECQSNVRISNSDLMKINRLNIMRLSSQTCCRCSRFMIIASLALCAARGALIALRAVNDTDVRALIHGTLVWETSAPDQIQLIAIMMSSTLTTSHLYLCIGQMFLSNATYITFNLSSSFLIQVHNSLLCLWC